MNAFPLLALLACAPAAAQTLPARLLERVSFDGRARPEEKRDPVPVYEERLRQARLERARLEKLFAEKPKSKNGTDSPARDGQITLKMLEKMTLLDQARNPGHWKDF